jgi:Zinc-binding dehydrogenase
MRPLSSEPSFNFNLLRWLGTAAYHGADIAEVLDVAERITPGDFESWHSQFLALAEHVEHEGWEHVRSSPITVRDRAFRAAAYYRAADFYLHGNPNNPRIKNTWAAATEQFDRAIGQLKPAGGTRHHPSRRLHGARDRVSSGASCDAAAYGLDVQRLRRQPGRDAPRVRVRRARMRLPRRDLRLLGADDVIDYHSEDFTRRNRPYDLILDLVAHRSVFAYRRVLARDGRYRCVGGSVSALFRVTTIGAIASRLTHRRMGVLAVKEGPDHFEPLADLCMAGDVSVHIDRTFALDDVPEALAHVGEGRAIGKVVVNTN